MMKPKIHNLEDIVRKATSSKVTPPKRKHVRNIILQTHNEHGASGFYHELFKRPLDRDEVICFKAMVTIHTVLQEGHPKVLEDSFYRVTLLESLVNFWKNLPKETSELICLYLDFLLNKIAFHHQHTEFAGDFSAEAYARRKPTIERTRMMQIVTHMQDLQQCIYKFQRKIFDGNRAMSECKASSLIPFVVESYNLYQLETQLIRELAKDEDSMDVLTVVIERFYSQFLTLKTFYNEAGMIKYVTSIIAVPTLPKDPPEFFAKKRVKSPAAQRKPAPKAVEPAPQPEPQPVVYQHPPPQPQPQPVYIPQPQVVPPASNPGWNPFASPSGAPGTSWVTFGSSDAPFPPATQHMTPVAPQPVVAQRGFVEAPKPNAPKATEGGFADLLSMVGNMKFTEDEKRKKEAERKQKEEQDRVRWEQERKRKDEEIRLKAERDREAKRKEDEARRRAQDEENRKKAQKEAEEKRRIEDEARNRVRDEERKKNEEERMKLEQERIKKIVQEESNNEIRELKLRISELETALDREKEKNREYSRELSELKTRLADAERSISTEQEASRQAAMTYDMKEATLAFLTSESQRMQAENATLQQRIESIQKEHQEENDRMLAKELDSARDAVELFLSRLDSPTNLGNDNATAREVVEDSTNLIGGADQLFAACRTGSREQLYSVVSSMIKGTEILFDDVKGASRKISNNDARQRLLDSARSAGAALANLLNMASNLNGRITDEDSLAEAQEDLDATKEKLNEVKAAATDAENATAVEEDNTGEDLEDLAEKELLAAARAIEAAAQTLLNAQSSRPKVAENAPDVAGAILDAAMAITKATAMLVTAAAVAQKERVEKGKIHSGPLYKRDPTWSQGLISSAKSVAAATQTLIITANDAVYGRIEEEAVVAASKGVASATAHLIAATRAKSDDPNGATEQKLNMASRAIAAAVAQLVAAAKAAAKPAADEFPKDFATTETARKIKEMEVQTQILKLEKDLEIARNRLGGMRKEWYSKA
eukprot:TRINITY_DN2106_c0_g1_i1.p1 TRINITY_DN2106_c0_g1~~TRINITY_DN2106_c0_g1_i1.p1  ORF type:complete len:1001 (-),score=389.23 TRINITY_DN2106_c0_g1_i1:15-3017(-)